MTDSGFWSRIDVSDWACVIPESQGSNGARWIEEPGTGRRWLHKNTVIPGTGLEQGEDWAEVLSTQVAAQLAVPCAQTRLCSFRGRNGSLSLSIIPPGYRLDDGGVRLEEVLPEIYHRHREGDPARDPARLNVKRPGHNLDNIALCLSDVRARRAFEGRHQWVLSVLSLVICYWMRWLRIGIGVTKTGRF